MAITFTIVGARQELSFETSDALLAALPAAKPGAVLRLNNTVAPFAITLATSYAAPGICIQLPVDQIVRFSAIGLAQANVEVIGGKFSNDAVTGSSEGVGYSIDIQNSSHIAIRGGTGAQGSNIINAVNSSYLEITDMLFEWSRGDILQSSNISHIVLARWFGRDTAIKGQKILRYTDGRLPVDGSPNISDGITSHWVDTLHGDAAQPRAGLTDALVEDCDFYFPGAGLVNYGTGGDDQNEWARVVIRNNTFLTSDAGAINGGGHDLLIEGNTVGPHPTIPGPDQVKMTIRRSPAGGKVQARNNTAINGAALTALDGVDFGSATLNGDAGVIAPVLPYLRRLPWAPAYSRPAYVASTAPPEVVSAPLLHWGGSAPVGAPPLGAWITLGRGLAKYVGTPTIECRWKRDGVIITEATARVYQLQSVDMGGKSITGEIRMTDPNGTGPWKSSAPLITA